MVLRRSLGEGGRVTNAAAIPEDRPLTPGEASLVRWLLEHGNSDAASFLPQLAHASVASRCGCGCASIDFVVAGATPPAGGGMRILSDYQWQGSDGSLFGVFVFARNGQLAGMEVWSIDGRSAPITLPRLGQLRPFNVAKDGCYC